MTSYDDFIKFYESDDWERVVGVTLRAEQLSDLTYVPIGQTDLGVSLMSPYLVIVVQPINARPTWRYGGEIRKVWNFPKGGETGTPLSKAQSKPTQLFVNKPQVVDLTRNGVGAYRLLYDPPTKDTQQPSNSKVAQNSNEAPNNDPQRVSAKSQNHLYLEALLLGAIMDLSQDMALQTSQDIEYLLTKAMLTSSLKIHTTGLERNLDYLERNYPWLMDLLENTLT